MAIKKTVNKQNTYVCRENIKDVIHKKEKAKEEKEKEKNIIMKIIIIQPAQLFEW